ncbi:hypothetical protein Nepgr_022995 [Nepenthes gracilis]|uniref:Uncharacterized protein n=1 Tax=Nepenthes gracilis TaxID=150966 RepID=A0AAD3SZZ3_NEPGR|nr:hypothetical protein Nepgr_022995 [Nepenthes gracilis]
MDGSEGAEVADERSLTAASDLKERIVAEKTEDPIFYAVVIWVVLGVHWELDSDAVGLPRGVSCSICKAPHMSFAAAAFFLYNRRCQLNVIYLIVAGSPGLRSVPQFGWCCLPLHCDCIELSAGPLWCADDGMVGASVDVFVLKTGPVSCCCTCTNPGLSLASAAGLLSGCCGAELWDFSCCFDDAASAGRCILAISCCWHFGFAWKWQFILSSRLKTRTKSPVPVVYEGGCKNSIPDQVLVDSASPDAGTSVNSPPVIVMDDGDLDQQTGSPANVMNL